MPCRHPCLHRAILGSVGNPVVVLDARGRFLRMNYQAADLLGRAGGALWDVFPAERAARYLSVVRAVLTAGRPFKGKTSMEIRGRPRWFQVHLRPIGQGRRASAICLATEITGVRETRQRLCESRARFRDLADLLPVIICEVDLDLRIAYVNEEGFRVFGYTPRDLEKGLTILQMLHPAEIERALNVFPEIVRGRTGGWGEYRVVRKDGTELNVLIKSAPLLIRGQPRGIRSVLVDTTERRQVESRLSESEARYRAVFTSAAMGLGLFDAAGRVVEANPALCGLLGCGPDELRGLFLGGMATPDEAGEILAELAAGGCDAVQGEKTVRRTDGSLFQARYTVSAVGGGTKTNLALVAVEDVTASRKMAEALDKLRRYESLATLAGGIAHDYRNILGAILAKEQLIETKLARGLEIMEDLRSLRRTVERATGLTRELLAYARGEPARRQAVPPAGLLQEAAALAVQRADVRCELRVPEEPWAIQVDEEQIGRVFVNLLANAEQAMPGGGRIEVTVENVVLGEGNTLALPGGPYVRISLRDEGIGITGEHLPRIFDPYFTTKPTGTGLGLAVAYAVVTSHGGRVEVESAPGEGTNFLVYLPALPAASAEQAAEGTAVHHASPPARRVEEVAGFSGD